MLEVGFRKDGIFLPAQICFIESIPEVLRKRKDIIGKFRKNPREKMDSVQGVVDEIIENPELEEWGLTLSTKPYEFNTRILAKPFLIAGSTTSKDNKTTATVLVEIVDKSSFNNAIL